MSLLPTFVVEAFRGAIQLAASVLAARDRRTVVLERRAKALRLFRELAAVGLRPRDLKAIEKSLTDEEDSGGCVEDSGRWQQHLGSPAAQQPASDKSPHTRLAQPRPDAVNL